MTSALALKNILNVTAKLSFTATPGYTGTVTFGLTATTCYGSYAQAVCCHTARRRASQHVYPLTAGGSCQGSLVQADLSSWASPSCQVTIQW